MCDRCRRRKKNEGKHQYEQSERRKKGKIVNHVVDK
jgi:hypothetical protein